MNTDETVRAFALTARHEILDLLLSPYSGVKDEFGKEVVSPLPLSVDRLFEGRKPASSSSLFRLPFELIARITQEIHRDALSSFALVNSDCRQLARSRQFASVSLNYSNKSFGILTVLIDESNKRSANKGTTEKLALGACIRKLTVHTDPEWITRRHNVELSQEFNALSQNEKTRRMVDACDMFFGSYMAFIEKILAHRTVLPYLELFDCEDRVNLRQSFFDALVSSNIRHLKINRANLNEIFAIRPPKSEEPRSWPLRTCHLELFPAMSTSLQLDVAPLCVSLFRLCASTLESLTWATCNQSPTRTDGVGHIPRFPALRHLRLEGINFSDDALLEEIFHDNLQSLECDPSDSSVLSDFLERRRHMPGLETLVLNIIDLKSGRITSLGFLQANPQLSKLSMPFGVPQDFLNIQLLPLLVHSYHNLTSLSLFWQELDEPSQILGKITQIRTLEQLHLSAGEKVNTGNDWPINHSLMQSYLSGLPLLKKLAFSRDSYYNGVSSGVENYYSFKWLGLENLLNTDWTDEKFERGHRERMLAIAGEYLEKMPQLEWLYFGQLPMEVNLDPKTGKKSPRALTIQREDCWNLLWDMFGWKGLQLSQ